MNPWQTLVATALVGTGKQAPVLPEAAAALKATLEQLDWSQPEQALLSAAGAIALHQQVGQQPQKPNWPTVEPCALDDLPNIERATAKQLETALSSYPAVLPELLSLIAKAGQRVPAQQLPQLLHLGQQKVELRPQIIAVIGKRGQWLATHQVDWGYACLGEADRFLPDAAAAQSIWQSGQRSERLWLLQRWRQSDPAAARAALEAVWSTELAKEREVFVGGLAINLTMADEPFLEAALSDRAKGVRQAAINLLVSLPASRLCQRMATRIQPLVQLQTQGQTLEVEVNLPDSYAPDWERDGIQATAGSAQGDRSAWLEQILAATPLDRWGEATKAIQAVKGHLWQKPLMFAWGLAAHRQQRIDWAVAWLGALDLQQPDEHLAERLLALLPPPQKEQQLRDLWPSGSSQEVLIRWLSLAAQSSQPWNLAFSRWIFAQLVLLLEDQPRNVYLLVQQIQNLRLTLHPDLAPEATTAVDRLSHQTSLPPYLESYLLELLAYLRFRQQIYQVF
ncbi:DUF5691 domain-containing protein [Almyronema epifaneia]|uniref:DUF5691 domain-containing protein n=1 Tax=Almyronema epifaneia S1 TaxID=2991925 RepID=A0ABW6IJF1_9CYAN